MSPELRRLIAASVLTPSAFFGSLFLQPELAASIGCLVALFVGLPLSVVMYFDYARRHAGTSSRLSPKVALLAVPIFVFGVLSLAIGLALIGWVIFNVLVERHPSYTGNQLLPTFGLGPLLIAFGWQLIRRPLSE